MIIRVIGTGKKPGGKVLESSSDMSLVGCAIIFVFRFELEILCSNVLACRPLHISIRPQEDVSVLIYIP